MRWGLLVVGPGSLAAAWILGLAPLFLYSLAQGDTQGVDFLGFWSHPGASLVVFAVGVLLGSFGAYAAARAGQPALGFLGAPIVWLALCVSVAISLRPGDFFYAARFEISLLLSLEFILGILGAPLVGYLCGRADRRGDLQAREAQRVESNLVLASEYEPAFVERDARVLARHKQP